MNFVQQLEECLRDLAAEARKKHPGVKEASERATLKLRTLKNTYVSQVRAANAGGEHPTTSLFQSSDLLHPFLLAANYPNAGSKLLEISFRAVKLLMEADAVVPTDGMHMVRVWTIQGQVVQAYYQKTFKDVVSAAAEFNNNSHHNHHIYSTSGSGQDAASAASASKAAAASTSSSSWFGSWGSSSTTSVVTSMSSAAMNTAASETTSVSVVKKSKNAVSSSTGQTGLSTQSPKEMEKLALEILSCLLQLLELLKNYPACQAASEIWTSSVALGCLWLHYLPVKHTVQQAAHSTVAQVLSLLYQQQSTGSDSSVSSKSQLLSQTWEDLLILAVGDWSHHNNATPALTLTGAFSQCRLQGSGGSACAAIPPSSEFALELMTQLWRRDTAPDTAKLLVTKTMSVTVRLLEQTLSEYSVEKSLRIFQWTLTVLQTQGKAYPNECRELFRWLIKPIGLATEACRSHDDFEDGFVYTRDEALAAGVLESGSNGAKESRRRAPASLGLASFIPTPVLWKAAMALEAIYLILEKDPQEFINFMGDGSTMAALAEALSDFATIGASCRDHMLQLIEFCQSHSNNNGGLDPALGPTKSVSETKPTVFRKAEQVVAAGNASSVFAADSSVRSADRKLSSSTPPSILGEALWIAFKGILRIADCLQSLEGTELLLEDTFAPTVAVLQHYLKRFVESNDLVELSLTGYKSLADVCLPLTGNALQRKALLASLCKLSLPTWGKLDASCQLQDHHVKALLCLVRIVHVHYDRISSGWQTILWTLEELSVMAIASPLLSDKAYQGALSVSAAYIRLAGFSTCFSTNSMVEFTEALTEISMRLMENRDVIGDSDTIIPERAVQSEASEKGGTDTRGISEKIMTIGVRAIYGSSPDEQESEDVPIAERTKNTFYEDYRRDFIQRVTASKSNIKVSSMGRIPLSLTLLVDVAMANSFRYKECGESTSEQLSRLAASSPAVRTFAMDTMAMLTMHHISKERSFPTPFVGPGRILFNNPRQNQLWAVESQKDSGGVEAFDSISQFELISPLCKYIRTTDKAEDAEAALGALNAILEGAGHNLHGDVWSVLIGAVSSLSGDPSYEIDRSSPDWSKCCLMAFRCLKLIVNDFLDQLSSVADSSNTALNTLLDCCSSFGSSSHDVNTSLTAIGLLWTIADRDAGTDAIDRALSKLVLLSSDSRAEVRNCSVNTLFSCVVGRGSGFSATQWESCICDTIFGIYDLVNSKARSDEDETHASTDASKGKASRYTVNMHHSRDSAGKQWAATQVLVLQGLMRVLRLFFPQLLDSVDSVEKIVRKDVDDAPWFQDAWVRILDFAFEASGQGEGRDALDIRSVGVEMLVVCCQLASRAGIQAATTPARVGTNMEVVNGALRSVRGPQTPKVQSKELKPSHSMATELSRQNLFLEAFESLESYQELLDKEAREANGCLSDDIRIQILHKFSSGLSKLHECCKDAEFSVNNAERSLRLLKNEAVEEASDDYLEPRFIKIIATVIRMAGVDPKSRFLNQAQRSSLDLLKSMALDGSCEAFKELVSLAERTFFLKREADGDDSQSGEVDETHTYTLLSFEAAAVVSEEVSKDSVSDECRVFVFAQTLSVFTSESEDVNPEKPKLPRRKRHYKLIVPIISQGLQSAARLETILGPSSKANYERLRPVDDIWKTFGCCLSELLSPVPVTKDLMKFPRVAELIQIVEVALESASPRYATGLCSIVASGASKALEVATLHDTFARANTESDIGRKSKKHQAEVLKLFATCFEGCCALQQDDLFLRSIAQQTLDGAVEALLDATEAEPTTADVRIEATLIVCQTMQKQKLESLVIYLFPLLCKLLTCKDARLRESVSDVFISVDVSRILQGAHSRYGEAEKRARQAEERAEVLSTQVEDLKRKNQALKLEVADLKASSAL
jgi:hypothetical protein